MNLVFGDRGFPEGLWPNGLEQLSYIDFFIKNLIDLLIKLMVILHDDQTFF